MRSSLRARFLGSVLALFAAFSLRGDALEDFVRALNASDAVQMRLVVSTNEEEMTKTFFGLLREAADGARGDRDATVKMLIVAAMIAQSFEWNGSDHLYRAMAEGRDKLTGAAQSIVSSRSLTAYVFSALDDMKRYTMLVPSGLESVPRAYLYTQLPPELRSLQDAIEAARKDAEAREAQRLAEERRRAEQARRDAIARHVVQKNVAALRKLFEESPDDVDVIRALALVGDRDTLIAAAAAEKGGVPLIEALATLPGAEPSEALVSLVVGNGEEARRTAATTALERRGAAAFPVLRKRMISAKTPENRLAIASVLARMKYEPNAVEEKAYLLFAQRRIHDVAVLGRPALIAARGMLAAKDARVVTDALNVIALCGLESDLDAVDPFLQADDESVRNAAKNAIRGVYGVTIAGMFQAQSRIWPPFPYVFFGGLGLTLALLRRRILRGTVRLLPRAVRLRIANASPASGFGSAAREVLVRPLEARLLGESHDLREPVTATLAELDAWRAPLPDSFAEQLRKKATARPALLAVLARDATIRGDVDGAAQLASRVADHCIRNPSAAWLVPVLVRLAAGPVREKLEGDGAAAVVLARHAFDSGNAAEGLQRLIRLLRTPPASDGLLAAAEKLVDERSAAGEADQRRLLEASRGGDGDARVAFGLIAIRGNLASSLAGAIDDRWVAACHALHGSTCGESFGAVVAELAQVPPRLAERAFVPPLMSAAAAAPAEVLEQIESRSDPLLAVVVDALKKRAATQPALLALAALDAVHRGAHDEATEMASELASRSLRDADAASLDPLVVRLAGGAAGQKLSADPAVSLVLARHAFDTGDVPGGFKRLFRFLRKPKGDDLLRLAERLLEERDAPGEADQSALRDAARRGDADARLALALVAIRGNLAPSIAGSTDDRWIAACHALREASTGEPFVEVLAGIELVPPRLAARVVLPALRAAAAATPVASCRFFRQHERPQVIESIEAPPSSIYGARIVCWNISGEQRDQIVVTGRGPAAVAPLAAAPLYDLASERSTTADIVLSGLIAMDLTQPGAARRRMITADDLLAAARELARREKIADILGRVDPSVIATVAPKVLRPTVALTREALARLELESGMVAIRDVDGSTIEAAEAALRDPSAPRPTESIPVLTRYRDGETPLEIEVPAAAFGLDEYLRVVREYRRLVRTRVLAEWSRRARIYEGWCRTSVHELRALDRMAAGPDGPARLARHTALIHWQTDVETAQQIPLDPPHPYPGTVRILELPPQIVDYVAWWALAEQKRAAASKETTDPPWAQSWLVDAFLRGISLPDEDDALAGAFAAWQSAWRPLALAAVDGGLRRRGVSLDAVAVEQTAFQVVDSSPATMKLVLLHVWDAALDPPPEERGGITLFHPRFGAREETRRPAAAAQQEAMETVSHALSTLPESWRDVVASLRMDSGGAVDAVIAYLAAPVDADIGPDLDQIRKRARAARDPLIPFIERVQKVGTVLEHLDCADEARRLATSSGLPDYLAWELFLKGIVVRHYLDTSSRQQMIYSLFDSVPGEIDAVALKSLRTAGIWDIVRAAGRGGAASRTIDAVLRVYRPDAAMSRRAPRIDGLSPVFTLGMLEQATGRASGSMAQTLQALTAAFPDYASTVLASEGPPPQSELRRSLSAPHCFDGWDVACYWIAYGDEAARLARALHDVGGERALEDSIARVSAHAIDDAFPELDTERTSLLEDLKRFGEANDAVSRERGTDHARAAAIDFFEQAESAWRRAAAHDFRYGVAWVRLASLQWGEGRYRAAIRTLAGPLPMATLYACHFPLELAVHLAGGSMTVTETRSSGMDRFAVDAAGAKLVIAALLGEEEVVRCEIDGLAADDRDRLAAFFGRYYPGMVESAGEASVREWLRLIRVPNLGRHAALAAALEDNADVPLITAGAELGVSVLRPPSPRKAEWLARDVITALRW